MPGSPDIERTTVSVRTLVICLWCAGGLLVWAAWVAAASWYGAQDRLERHDEALTQILKNQQDQKTSIEAAQVAYQQLATSQLTLSQQLAAVQKKMDDYRPFKWSTPMMIEYNEQLQAKNPAVSTPDAQAIHDKVLPFTP